MVEASVDPWLGRRRAARVFGLTALVAAFLVSATLGAEANFIVVAIVIWASLSGALAAMLFWRSFALARGPWACVGWGVATVFASYPLFALPFGVGHAIEHAEGAGAVEMGLEFLKGYPIALVFSAMASAGVTLPVGAFGGWIYWRIYRRADHKAASEA